MTAAVFVDTSVRVNGCLPSPGRHLGGRTLRML
jgi:hypothetical protein